MQPQKNFQKKTRQKFARMWKETRQKFARMWKVDLFSLDVKNTYTEQRLNIFSDLGVGGGFTKF